MSIPEGWTIKREDSPPFKAIELSYIKDGVRYATTVYSHERNPANILYMLADALLGPHCAERGWLTPAHQFNDTNHTT